MDDCGEFPIELLAFFYLLNGTHSFVLNALVYNRHDLTLDSKYNFGCLKQRIMDIQRLVDEMYFFYFPNSTKRDFTYTDRAFLCQIEQEIQNSNYPPEVRYSILGFFTNPERYATLLCHELDVKNVILSNYYRKHLEELFGYVNDFDAAFLVKNFSARNKFDTTEIYFSICLFNRGQIHYDIDFDLFSVGFDYKRSYAASLCGYRIDLVEVGKVLGDKSRMLLISMLAETDEEQTSVLAKKLGLSLNATIYHLNMMIKVGIVSSSSRGRCVYYRLEHRAIRSIIEQMSTWLNREVTENESLVCTDSSHAFRKRLKTPC